MQCFEAIYNSFGCVIVGELFRHTAQVILNYKNEFSFSRLQTLSVADTCDFIISMFYYDMEVVYMAMFERGQVMIWRRGLSGRSAPRVKDSGIPGQATTYGEGPPSTSHHIANILHKQEEG